MTVFNRRQMPALDGVTEWLNSEPIGPVELRGHVVISVDTVFQLDPSAQAP
jgi:hypothetical protein